MRPRGLSIVLSAPALQIQFRPARYGKHSEDAGAAGGATERPLVPPEYLQKLPTYNTPRRVAVSERDRPEAAHRYVPIWCWASELRRPDHH
jgi:hypothetical protein